MLVSSAVINVIIKDIEQLFINRSGIKKLLALMAFPFLPVILHIDAIGFSEEEKQAEKIAFSCTIKMFGHANEFENTRKKAEAKVIMARENKYRTIALISQVKITDSVVKDFVQVALLMVVVLTIKSDTRNTSAGEDKILVDSASFEFLAASATFSLFGLIQGHLGLMTATKKGFKSLMGTIIMFIYFLVSISARYILNFNINLLSKIYIKPTT